MSRIFVCFHSTFEDENCYSTSEVGAIANIKRLAMETKTPISDWSYRMMEENVCFHSIIDNDFGFNEFTMMDFIPIADGECGSLFQLIERYLANSMNIIKSAHSIEMDVMNFIKMFDRKCEYQINDINHRIQPRIIDRDNGIDTNADLTNILICTQIYSMSFCCVKKIDEVYIFEHIEIRCWKPTCYYLRNETQYTLLLKE
jgi:hypothetical protein